MPEPLYRYLQEMEATGSVYKVSREGGKYTVELLDSYIDYNIATGKIYYPEADVKTEAWISSKGMTESGRLPD